MMRKILFYKLRINSRGQFYFKFKSESWWLTQLSPGLSHNKIYNNNNNKIYNLGKGIQAVISENTKSLLENLPQYVISIFLCNSLHAKINVVSRKICRQKTSSFGKFKVQSSENPNISGFFSKFKENMILRSNFLTQYG